MTARALITFFLRYDLRITSYTFKIYKVFNSAYRNMNDYHHSFSSDLYSIISVLW